MDRAPEAPIDRAPEAPDGVPEAPGRLPEAPDDGTVTAADIARLAGVGRAAVSNWRRRHPDFPRPVGGTSASPVFSLGQVTAWLRGQGKLREVPIEEEVWQRVRAAAGDTSPAAVIGEVGVFLLHLAAGTAVPPASSGTAWDAVLRSVQQLAEAWGAREALEFLAGRHIETHSRRSDITPPQVAALMADLLDPGAGPVLDPACGPGTLLLDAVRGSQRPLFGQERDAGLAQIARTRLAFRTSGASGASGASGVDVRAGDALRQDAFAGTTVDAVLCDPPFHDRHWGYEDLTADPRWEYGLPPRMEPELAWVQHALAHLVPGGLAAVLMPPAAAGRRSGRRIRAELLRRGALRAVAALSDSHHLWLLRRPSGAAPPGVLMVEGAEPDAVVRLWRAFQHAPDVDEPGIARAVPLIDLLDDEVDLAPGRHVAASGSARTTQEYVRTRDRMAALVRRLDSLVPDAEPAAPRDVPDTSVSELVRIGVLTVLQGPSGRDPDPDPAGRPLLTADDVAEGRAPSGRVLPGEPWITLRTGDVVVTAAARRFAARVVDEGGALLGHHLWLLRADPAALDPHYLAGILRSTANTRSAAGATTGGRTDPRRARVPRPPLDEQRRLGAIFRRAQELEHALRDGAALGGEMARLLADGVVQGRLRPPAS
ncbi:N-6 DNA methylase [Actinomadura rubrisoli]|uniref:N-6 DNA methylase n=1 Tax=Actinomadura rubrisoli TaxID=2530368 RepID=A0A4V2YWU6_9ACTN|nr:N-6 DNA methylase [Actinomadura rubrisoli]TDD86827.1 N-6 DNA methylase [Actinomadura rubrisoli]